MLIRPRSFSEKFIRKNWDCRLVDVRLLLLHFGTCSVTKISGDGCQESRWPKSIYIYGVNGGTR